MIFNMIFVVIIILTIALISDTTELPSPEITDPFYRNYEFAFISALFRHGDRTPDFLYPGDPNSEDDFEPPGLGMLTPAGRERARQLGVELHERYHDLLGEIYIPNEVIARSTNMNRTKDSLIMVLRGLYSDTKQLFIRSYPANADILLLPTVASFKYYYAVKEVYKLEEVRREINERKLLKSKLLYDITGFPSTSLNQLYYTLTSEANMGVKIPEWAQNNSVIQQLENGILDSYKYRSFNTALRKLNGGFVLKNITESMIGVANGTINDGRKIQLFAGHDGNVAAFLSTLGVFTPHVPEYSSCVIVELLRDNHDVYHVGIRYNLGIPQITTILRIPGCSDPCPLDTFVQLMRDVTPIDGDSITFTDLIG